MQLASGQYIAKDSLKFLFSIFYVVHSYYSYYIIITGCGYLFSNQLRWSEPDTIWSEKI